MAVVLPPPTDEERQIAARAERYRLALSGDNEVLRARYEEIMRWLNPPWDPISRRIDPRIERASADRGGDNIFHIDLVNPAVDRWAALQAGVPFTFRCRPRYVPPPVEWPDDSERTVYERKQWEIDRQIAMNEASQIENQTLEWLQATSFFRVLYWAAFAKEAFGKAILRSGWDDSEGLPTVELMENPSQVYYGWSRRFGRRRLAWVIVDEEIAPEEAAIRFNVKLPLDEKGQLNLALWRGSISTSDMDQRSEQQGEVMRYVHVSEFWELVTDTDGSIIPQYSLILAGRVIDGPYRYRGLRRLPFHILENQHIPTWSHGKSLAEVVIPINAAIDDMLDRQQRVIRFESGPRYIGLNMFNTGDEIDVPEPFQLLPLREGEDIRQLDTRIDIWPTQLHDAHLKDALHRGSGLTPIAWGMSPNAQTSGRAMSAEWRAVELPLTGKLVNMTPEIIDLISSWWDYAELYRPEYKEIGKGIRRFEILWAPFDIRDRTEKTQDILARYNAKLLDPITAIEESGYENSDEIYARIRSMLLDPIWSPLHYQQLLTLQQLELSIRQAMLQVQAQEAQLQGAQQQPGPGEIISQGTRAAVMEAQAPGGPVTEAQNQPGQVAVPTGLPIELGILSRTPLQGGVGNQAVVPLPVAGVGAPVPTRGQQPR